MFETISWIHLDSGKGITFKVIPLILVPKVSTMSTTPPHLVIVGEGHAKKMNER